MFEDPNRLMVYAMGKRKDRKRSTETSEFGSPGRRSHDASKFYNSRLYDELPKEQDDIVYTEKPVPPEVLDQIFLQSSEEMNQLPDDCVHLMVTSPPYNVGKVYDEDLTLQEYLQFLHRVLKEVHRVLVTGGRACVNIANLGRKPYLPLHTWIIQDMLSLDFLMRGEIIWDKGSSAAASTAWGSWLSPSNPTLRDVHEYILVFSKGAYKRQPPKKRARTISRDEFLEWTKSVWAFSAESAKRVNHPAPFPVELPTRLIHLYTYKGEVVLDPFIGSGSTAVAAVNTKRHFVGYDINEAYVQIAQKRVQEATRKP